MSPWFDYPIQQWRERHAVVVGAGIAGCQIAWHLAKLGWRVTLLERENQISSQASGNLAGIISPLMSTKPNKTEAFYLHAFEHTLQHLKALKAAGLDVDWFDCGVLQLAHSERELQRWHALHTRQLPTDFIQHLDAEQATKMAGIPCHYPANYFPQAGYINPASWCQALINDSDCRLLTSTQASELTYTANQQWSVLDESGTPLVSAEVVVLSNGQDINLFPQSNTLPLANVLGQTTLARTDADQLKCAINHEGYVTPSYQGTHVFGATFDREFTKIEKNPQSDLQNIKQLATHLPELAASFNDSHTGHAGVRSTSPDRLPYAGGVYDYKYYVEHYAALKQGNRTSNYPPARYHKGLYVLGGLGSRGLTSSSLCAHKLSALIDNHRSEELSKQLETLHPARFLIRLLKQGKTNFS